MPDLTYDQLTYPTASGFDPAAVACWNGDGDAEYNGDLLDLWGSNNGAWVNGANYQAPPSVANARDALGHPEGQTFLIEAARHIDVAPSMNGFGDFTFCSWVYFPAAEPNTPGRRIYAEINGAATLGMHVGYNWSTEFLFLRIDGTLVTWDAAVEPFNVETDSWRFVCYRRVGTTVTLSLDKTNLTTRTVSGTITSAGTSGNIGCGQDTDSLRWPGSLYYTRIYSRALSDVERDTIHDARGAKPTPTPLRKYEIYNKIAAYTPCTNTAGATGSQAALTPALYNNGWGTTWANFWLLNQFGVIPTYNIWLWMPCGDVRSLSHVSSIFAGSVLLPFSSRLHLLSSSDANLQAVGDADAIYQFWRPVVRGDHTGGIPVRVMAYHGALHDAYLQTLDDATFISKCDETIQPWVDAGCDIGFDASFGYTTGDRKFEYIESVKARGIGVQIEGRPENAELDLGGAFEVFPRCIANDPQGDESDWDQTNWNVNLPATKLRSQLNYTDETWAGIYQGSSHDDAETAEQLIHEGRNYRPVVGIHINADFRIELGDPGPAAVAALSLSGTLESGSLVTADMSGSTNADLYYADWGDGNVVGPQASATLTNTYAAAGKYDVTFWAEGEGGKDTIATMLQIGTAGAVIGFLSRDVRVA